MKRSDKASDNWITGLPFVKKRRDTPGEQRRRERAQRRASFVKGSRPFVRFSIPRVGLAFGTAALLSLLLCIHLLPNRVSWKLGDVADREIVAPRTVRYEDTAATERMRGDAANQVEEQYDTISGAKSTAQEAVGIIFDRIEETVRDRHAPAVSLPSATPAPTSTPKAEILTREASDTAARIRRELGVAPHPEDIGRLLAQDETTRQQARVVADRMVVRAMSRDITDRSNDLREARDELFREDILKGLNSGPLRDSVAALVGLTLTPNRHVNDPETERERAAARASVPPQVRRLPTGTVVIRPGERVAQVHLDQFAALGLRNDRLDALTVATIILLVCLMLALATVYIRQFHADLYNNLRLLLLLSILSVFSVLGLKIGSALLGLSAVPGVHFGYLGMMCVASAGMVVALLISPRVALLMVALLSVVSGLVLNNELRFTVITLGSSLVGIVCISTLKNRGDLMRSTLILCAANAVLNVIVGHLEGDPSNELLMSALWGIVSGVFALALFYFGVAAFEKPFGITTHLRLLELTDPATPILQEFRLKVPGTYAHSLMVSNLGQAAAEAIRADALLVRVAAYYHDLGKMNRPEFFIENQSNAENIHDRIAPSLSAIILASHVKEGVEIAQQIGLPPLVIELIQQHHGTSLMRYFYHRATGGLPDPTLEAQFRYAGPKPQTKEAAILMIADSVEAASRTLVRPTPTKISDFVARIIEEKRADGQLEECDLTLQDLKTIQTAIARTLSGALHARVEYPGTTSTSKSEVGGEPVGFPRTHDGATLPPRGNFASTDVRLLTDTPLTDNGDSSANTPVPAQPFGSDSTPVGRGGGGGAAAA